MGIWMSAISFLNCSLDGTFFGKASVYGVGKAMQSYFLRQTQMVLLPRGIRAPFENNSSRVLPLLQLEKQETNEIGNCKSF